MDKYLISSKDSSRSSSSSSNSKDKKKEPKPVPTSQLLAEAGPIFILGTFQGHTKLKITKMIEAAGGSCSDDIEDDAIRYSIISPAIWALESTKGANRVLRSLKDANEANESHLKALFKKWDRKTKKGEESEEEEEVEDEEEDDGERDFDKYRIWICPLEWLQDCIKEGQMVDPDDYDYQRIEKYRRDENSKRAAEERKKNGGKSKYKIGERRKLAEDARIAREEKEMDALVAAEEREAARVLLAAEHAANMAALYGSHVFNPYGIANPVANPVISATPAVTYKKPTMDEWRAQRAAREAAAAAKYAVSVPKAPLTAEQVRKEAIEKRLAKFGGITSSASIDLTGKDENSRASGSGAKPVPKVPSSSTSSTSTSIVISDSEEDEPLRMVARPPQKKSSAFQPQPQVKKRAFDNAPIVLDSDSDDEDLPIAQRLLDIQPLAKRVKSS